MIKYTSSPTSPAFDCAEITPADADLSRPARALYVGVAGDVEIIPLKGDGSTTVLFKNVPAGKELAIGCLQVRATNTTATNIVAYYE